MARSRKNKHHGWQVYRGGPDETDKISEKTGEVLEKGYPPNVRKIDKELLHRPYHALAAEERRIAELIAVVVFCWETFCPYQEVRQPRIWKSRKGLQTRKKAFETLFGEGASQRKVIATLLREFVFTTEDKEQVSDVLENGLHCGLITFDDLDYFLEIMEEVVRRR